MQARTKILVIDDSPDFQLFMQTLLPAEHYVLLASSDTLQATGRALRDKPALIILDLILPGGDGWMLLDRFKTNILTKHIPILIVTGQTKPGLEKQSTLKGAAGFFHKPIEKDRFLTTIKALLAAPTPIPM